MWQQQAPRVLQRRPPGVRLRTNVRPPQTFSRGARQHSVTNSTLSSQVATHPLNSAVFERLLERRLRGAPQLAMAPAAAFGAAGGSGLSFGAAAEAAMCAGVLPIGYRRHDGRMLLAPAHDEAVGWADGDELVVVADGIGGGGWVS